MKAVLAVDLMGAYSPAWNLFKGLRFQDSEVSLVNVVEPLLPDSSIPELGASQPMAQILEELQEAGRTLLDRVATEVPATSKEVVLGHAPTSIMQVADQHGAEMILIGSQKKSMFEMLFTGSVTRALASGSEQSLLIGKSDPRSSEGLSVVVCHDISDYSSRAIDKFVSLRPEGISKIVVVTANVTDPSIVAVMERTHPDLAGETVEIIKSRIDKSLETVAGTLRTVCNDVRTVVSEGSANQVIDETYKSSKADLLVMGAQGHGFLERLMIGSSAMHQVVRTDNNLLIVRA